MPDDQPTDQTDQQSQDCPSDQQGQQDTNDQQQTDQGQPQEPETFTREYVQQLRDESAGHRVRAKDRDTLAARLHTALVAATGRLADPTDLPFDEEHLTDDTKLTAAIEGLLTRKPHLASRRPAGDVGQGATGDGHPVDLAGILRGLAS